MPIALLELPCRCGDPGGRAGVCRGECRERVVRADGLRGANGGVRGGSRGKKADRRHRCGVCRCSRRIRPRPVDALRSLPPGARRVRFSRNAGGRRSRRHVDSGRTFALCLQIEMSRREDSADGKAPWATSQSAEPASSTSRLLQRWRSPIRPRSALPSRAQEVARTRP